MNLPHEHPLRRELNDEVHARPPEILVAPCRISYLAMLSKPAQREEEQRHIEVLAKRSELAPPSADASHYRADFGRFRLKWERHTEFTRYKFVVDSAGDDPFDQTALAAVPAEWVAVIPGSLMVAVNVALLRGGDPSPDHDMLSRKVFDGNVLVGSAIADGDGEAYTDFRIRSDGSSRYVVRNAGMTPRQAGRMVQRLLEIDTYRIMALLALPVARELAPALARSEQELAQIATALSDATEADEPALLDRLTRLEAEIGKRAADNDYRFAAAAAYHDLVLRRITELRETRVQGLQTLQEFTERRLAPAMRTCEAIAARQAALTARAARTTQLLATRVDITRERQNQAVLESMDRRAEQQLRLQQTVEGLSVAAVTYYVVGLVSYLAVAGESTGYLSNAKLVAAISIPVVALLVGLRLRRFRRNASHRPG